MSETPTTPRDWLEFLLPLLADQAERIQIYRDYYAGRQRIAYATQRFSEIFGRFFPAAPDNWCQIIVDAPVERLGIQSFRFDGQEAKADDEAWKVWQGNNLDARQNVLYTEAVKCGLAYLLVDTTASPARITCEHPNECFVYRDPDGTRLAGVKRWVDEADKHSYAILYLPDRIHRFRSASESTTLSRADWVGDGSFPNTARNAGKPVVPLIPVENNPDMLTGGTSDLDVVIPIQDRINKLCLDLDVNSEFHAAPQRWATGWDPPVDENGRALPQTKIEAATSRFLAFSDPDARVGSLPPGDPQAYVKPIEMYVQHLSALSRIPPHYLLGRMVNISGDALKGAETGLAAKTVAKQVDFSDPFEEALGISTGRDSTSAEVIWKDAESRTFGQLVDGVIKLRQEVALPLEMAWEMIGLTPQQIDRAKKLIGLPERDFRALDRGKLEMQRDAVTQNNLNQNNGGNPNQNQNQEAGATPPSES